MGRKKVECICIVCGETFMSSHNRTLYCNKPECQDQKSYWSKKRDERMAEGREPLEDRYLRSNTPKERVWPVHRCSKPGCSNMTTNRFLCDFCFDVTKVEPSPEVVNQGCSKVLLY